ncbi:uncharacterized protein [Scyliorhinus torazame]|uniref:uncharacterized protein n=1 Tax=Scyliorhinus torazame TaxID=75743 RepID=UPI003B5A1E15
MDRTDKPQPLQVAGNLGTNWKLFRQRFDLYIRATEKQSASDETKIAMLLFYAGQHATDVFNSLVFEEGENQSKYDTVILKLDQHFQVEVNESFERYLFQQRLQGKEELFQPFLTHLRILAQSCGYGTTTESMIRDQIVFGVASSGLRQQLLKIKSLTLASAVEACVLHENATCRFARFQASELARRGSPAVESASQAAHDVERIQAVDYFPTHGPDDSGRFPRFSRSPAQVRAKNNGHNEGRTAQARPPQDRTAHAQWRNERRDVMTCSNCGGLHLKGQCPAKNRQCLRCGKMGHYAAHCRSAQPMDPAHPRQSRRQVRTV